MCSEFLFLFDRMELKISHASWWRWMGCGILPWHGFLFFFPTLVRSRRIFCGVCRGVLVAALGMPLPWVPVIVLVFSSPLTFSCRRLISSLTHFVTATRTTQRHHYLGFAVPPLTPLSTAYSVSYGIGKLSRSAV